MTATAELRGFLCPCQLHDPDRNFISFSFPHMKEAIEVMSEELRRSRRSLLLVCVILWFLRFGGVELDDAIRVLGVGLRISEPHAIYISLWVLWLYFVVRYGQYYVEEGLRRVSDVSRAITVKLLQPKIEKHVRGAAETGKQDTINGSYSYESLKKRFFLQREFRGELGVYDPRAGKPRVTPLVLPVPIRVWLWPLVKSRAQLAAHSAFTDHVLPWAVAIGVFVYCNLGKWPGSIPNLFRGP